MKVVARCVKCGREFLTDDGEMIDEYPPLGWKPAGGWGTWRGERDERYPPPTCGGQIVPIQQAQVTKP